MDNIFGVLNVFFIYTKMKIYFLKLNTVSFFRQLVLKQKNVQVVNELMHSNLGKIQDVSQSPQFMKLISTTSLV